jgi:hypothetical protein
LWFDFGKAWDTVVISHLAGGDRSPEHGGKLRLDRRQVATGARVDEAFEDRHCAGVHQGIDQFPISRIPADKQ